MPSNLGALYSSRSRKTFFIVLKRTSEHPGLQGEWWYTMGIEQLSCTFSPGLLASLWRYILCHFCCLYMFYPIGDGFCLAGPWDFTCRWLNMLSSGNLEAVTSSCVTTSFLLPKWTLHHVWIFFHRPRNDGTQSWSPMHPNLGKVGRIVFCDGDTSQLEQLGSQWKSFPMLQEF